MPHVFFSPRRLAAISSNTLRELTRMRVFHTLLLFALVLIGSSSFLARLSFQPGAQVFQDVGLGAMSIFISLLAILVTARLLPQDREDRTVQTILARAVPRFEYVAGRLAGVLLMLALSLVAMATLFVAMLLFFAPADSVAGLPAPFAGNLLPAIVVIYLKGCLLAALTLFLSTFASSSSFAVLAAVLVYFIGHLQGMAREFWLHEHGAGWVGRIFLAGVALCFPDLQLFDFSDALAAQRAIPFRLFAETMGLGAFYVVLYLLLAIAVFNGREL